MPSYVGDVIITALGFSVSKYGLRMLTVVFSGIPHS